MLKVLSRSCKKFTVGISLDAVLGKLATKRTCDIKSELHIKCLALMDICLRDMICVERPFNAGSVGYSNWDNEFIIEFDYVTRDLTYALETEDLGKLQTKLTPWFEETLLQNAIVIDIPTVNIGRIVQRMNALDNLSGNIITYKVTKSKEIVSRLTAMVATNNAAIVHKIRMMSA